MSETIERLVKTIRSRKRSDTKSSYTSFLLSKGRDHCLNKLKEEVNELEEAIKNNGTTISDFRRVDDKTGKFQQFLQVYGKDNQACLECDVPIQRIVQQQRSTYFCHECQK